MSMTPHERFLCALNRDEPDRVPYFELVIDHSIVHKLLGEAPVEGFVETGPSNLDIELEKRISRLLHRDCVCYGWRAPVPTRLISGKNGRVFYGDGLVKSEQDLDKLDFPDPYDDSHYEPARKFLKKKDEFAAVFITRAGAAPAMLCMGQTTFTYAMYDNPALIDEIVRRYTDWSAAVIERMIDLGFDVVCCTDDLAFNTGPFLTPQQFRRFLLPGYKKVADKITVPWISHSDGNFMPIMEDFLSLGMSGIHPIEPDAMDINEVKRNYGHRVCILGNINVGLLAHGTPEEVEALVKKRLRELAPGGGYILSSGNSIPSYCKPENVLAMTRTLERYGAYPISIP